jgi:drug/metabolite transporter superfamily protein YnfA
MQLMVGYSQCQLSFGGRIVDKKKPDGYEIIGSIVAVVGALVIFYAPR